MSEELLKAAIALRDDMIARAKANDADDIVVEAGAGVWHRFNEAINASQPVEGLREALATHPTAEAVREACAEVVEEVRSHWTSGEATTIYGQGYQAACSHAAAAIRAMPLPQAEAAKVEPVAWLYAHGEGGCRVVTPLTERAEHMKERGWTETPLIPAPKGHSDDL